MATAGITYMCSGPVPGPYVAIGEFKVTYEPSAVGSGASVNVYHPATVSYMVGHPIRTNQFSQLYAAVAEYLVTAPSSAGADVYVFTLEGTKSIPPAGVSAKPSLCAWENVGSPQPSEVSGVGGVTQNSRVLYGGFAPECLNRYEALRFRVSSQAAATHTTPFRVVIGLHEQSRRRR
jgi:hypothetical protein